MSGQMEDSWQTVLAIHLFDHSVQVDGQDVLAAGLLATLHHEMSVGAGAAPLAFNALGMGASPNDGVGSTIGGGILNSPNIGTSALHSAVLGTA